MSVRNSPPVPGIAFLPALDPALAAALAPRSIAIVGASDDQALSRRGSLLSLMGLAVTAAAIEVASMLPYLAAIGIIATQGPAWPTSGLLLLGYCVVMVLPALLLMVGRLLASRVLEKPLRQLDTWLTRNAASATAWVVGIVGALLAANAAGALDWI